MRARMLVVSLLTMAATGCSEGGGPIAPGPGTDQRLAGGGRAANDDPFGGEVSSGPAGREIAPISDYAPLLFADINCFSGPFQRVIRTQQEWHTWWTTAVSCLPRPEPIGDPPPRPSDPPGGGGIADPGGSVGGPGYLAYPDSGSVLPIDPVYPDSGSVEPGFPIDPYGPVAPEVSFSDYVVVVIGLEAESAWGRGLWVTDVTDGPTGTTIKFEVSKPGEDCFVLFEGPPDPGASSNSPTVAVLVPAPVADPVTFERLDVTWTCTWEPDPTLPLSLYYTDVECDLGPAEAIISEGAAWESWVNTAISCDRALWGDPDSTVTGGGGQDEPGKPPTTGGGVDPAIPPIEWLGVEVDFATHAVLVLRGDAQSRWGGGIWLDSFDATSGGTVIDYSVMEPSGQCPEVEGGRTVRPTAAIRLPLPLNAPVRYNRRVETIDCDWEPLPLPAEPSTPSGR
jgi:hypothetical protein